MLHVKWILYNVSIVDDTERVKHSGFLNQISNATQYKTKSLICSSGEASIGYYSYRFVQNLLNGTAGLGVFVKHVNNLEILLAIDISSDISIRSK